MAKDSSSKSRKLLNWKTVVAAVVVLYAVIGFFVVPAVAKKLIVDIAGERTGREVTVEEVKCNPFMLSLTVRGFSMPDRPGSKLLAFDELYANAQASSLFRFAATLKELRITNPYIGVRRFPDGGVNLLELMDDIEARTPQKEDEEEDEGGLPRALLQHILVTGSVIDVEDLAREEPLLWTIGPSTLDLHDISTIPDSKGGNAFMIALEGGGKVGIVGDVVVEPLGLDGTVTIDNVNLDRLWEAAAPYFEFTVIDGVVGGRFDYSVFLADDGPHAVIDEAELLVTGIELTAGRLDATVLTVDSFATEGFTIAWPEAAVRASEISASGAEVFQWIREDGSFSWDALVPKETQEVVVETYKKIEEAFPWEIAVDRVAVDSAILCFEDRTFSEPIEHRVEEISAEVTDIVTEKGSKWGLKTSAMVLGEAPATVDGFIGTAPMRIEVDVAISDLDLGRFQPYIERAAPMELHAGKVEVEGKATIEGGGAEPAAGFTGDVHILEIDLRENAVGSTVLKWGKVDALGINAGAGPLSVEMASLDIHGAGIEVVVSQDGKINLIELLRVMAEKSSGEPAVGTDDDEIGSLPIKVDNVALHGCSAAYTDRTLNPPFTMAVDPVGGVIEGVKTGTTAGASIEIDGPVRSGGMVHIRGELDLFDPKRLTDLAIDVFQAETPPASPLAVLVFGHSVENGKVDIDLDYEVVNSELVGTNRFVTYGLELGERVEGDRVIDLPIKLGVSLLTDKNGQITLEIPIEGNLDDPGFGLGNAIESAVKEVVSELVKSPFRLLGKLGGGSSDEDFGFVEFAAGSAELESSARDKLATLTAGIDQRPELVLIVEGTLDPEADSAALKETALEAVTAEKQGPDAGPASLETLEAIYRDAAGGQVLGELRARHEGAEGIDVTAYYRDLRAAVVEAQPVNSTTLQALAATRTETIRAFLVDALGAASNRVRIIDPIVLEESSGDGWVRCRLDVSTGG